MKSTLQASRTYRNPGFWDELTYLSRTSFMVTSIQQSYTNDMRQLPPLINVYGLPETPTWSRNPKVDFEAAAHI